MSGALSLFSPRMRRCSFGGRHGPDRLNVSPAQAEVSPSLSSTAVRVSNVPSRRRGCPLRDAYRLQHQQLSQRKLGCSCLCQCFFLNCTFFLRMRGCALCPFRRRRNCRIFPAHTGVFPSMGATSSPALSFPCVAGVFPPLRKRCCLDGGPPAHAGVFTDFQTDYPYIHGTTAQVPRCRPGSSRSTPTKRRSCRSG